MRKAFVITVMLIVVPYGTCYSAPETFRVYGIGNSSCEELTKILDNRNSDKAHSLMALSWVQGYVTAMSEVVEPMERISATGAMSFLDKYCREKGCVKNFV